MSRISSTLKSLSDRSEKALITYVMAGDPSLEKTEELVVALERAGADLIELGIPFSDPVADGPVIQQAAERALRQRVSLRSVLELVRRLRKKTEVPLILMTYLNPILRMGIEAFLKQATQAGVDGVIVPDLPMEEGEGLSTLAGGAGIDLIFFAAPTTSLSRLGEVARLSAGFLYYVSLTGITGGSLSDLREIEKRVAAVKRKSRLPVAVGFGISTPEEARALGRCADGVIVGTAIVRLIAQYGESPDLVRALTQYVRSLKAGLNPG